MGSECRSQSEAGRAIGGKAKVKLNPESDGKVKEKLKRESDGKVKVKLNPER